MTKKEPEQTPDKAAIYSRVACVHSKMDVVAVNAGQVQRCREHAQTKRYAVDAVFSDIGSGKWIDRPGLKSLLEYLRSNRAENYPVLVDNPQRISRRTSAFVEITKRIRAAGGRLEAVDPILLETAKDVRKNPVEQDRER